MKTAAYVMCVLMLAVVVSGCGLIEKKTDPVTGKETKYLTEKGAQVVEGGKTIGKAFTTPLGIPPGVWDAVVAAALGIAGIETSRRVVEVKKSKEGKLIG
jgi:uncharacterized protein YceK